jgi:hypothetical protein
LVPANSLELGTIESIGIRDRYNGISDLRSGRFHFELKQTEERYPHHEWYPERRLDHALAFMQILLEELPRRFGTNPTSYLLEQPGLKDCLPFLRQSMELIAGKSTQPVESRHRIKAENRYLELFSAATDAELWRELWSLALDGTIGFQDGFLKVDGWRWLPSSLEHPDSCGFASSSRTIRFVDPRITANSQGKILTGRAAIEKGILPLFSENDLPDIARGQDVVSSSDAILLELSPDKSRESPGWGDFENGHDEFLYFQLPFSGDPARVEIAGAIIELNRRAGWNVRENDSSQGEHRACLFALPSDVRLKRVSDRDGKIGSNDMLQVRLNCGRILDGIAGLASTTEESTGCPWSLKVHVLADSEKPSAPELVWQITE